MKSPERQQLHSSILHHLLMFKIIVLFLFNNRECFDGKLDQRKAVKSVVPNARPDTGLPKSRAGGQGQ